jgi:hypothetical protein
MSRNPARGGHPKSVPKKSFVDQKSVEQKSVGSKKLKAAPLPSRPVLNSVLRVEEKVAAARCDAFYDACVTHFWSL